MDETYIKVSGRWRYLYRAIDREGNLLDWFCQNSASGRNSIVPLTEQTQTGLIRSGGACSRPG
ncbi:MAG: DDE-type integrase/transposase/recombinase [Chloroflexi bacterium]|nr:DDE-type integrase/transposase/recombinase [Chloroflexota bacterium]MBT3862309.1 DDE-type integrase/transposase/recombinase [Chloroflexota bacterium]MBT4143139.1 DDE-type integrase/transposase/recombinase [Chloroflexota bacterium]MBT4942907.1 DDE-type integrase/transposase/recombinase [Chloroflexota bacterium]MBT5252024.1 DDE-type integrase/transposase/recombinase [Chloroflexota bacterium]